MRRHLFIVALLAALASAAALGALKLAQAEPALAQGACPGSIMTTDETGTVNKNQYAAGESVFIDGSNFPPAAELTFTVTHVATGQLMTSGGPFSADAAGSFSAEFVWDGTDALPDGGPYQVVVVYTSAAGAPCSKSDNFRYQGPPDTTPPTPPEELTATADPEGTVDLDWKPSTDDGNDVDYNMHRSTTPSFTPSPSNLIAEPTGTSYTDAPGSPAAYYFRVTAEDAAGNVSAPSNEASATVLAAATEPAGELPRTGLPAGLVGAAGLGLIAGGLVLSRTRRR